MLHFVAHDLSEAEELPYDMIAVGDTISATIDDQRILAKKVDVGSHGEFGTHAWMVLSHEEEDILKAMREAGSVIYLHGRARA